MSLKNDDNSKKLGSSSSEEEESEYESEEESSKGYSENGIESPKFTPGVVGSAIKPLSNLGKTQTS